MDSLTQNTQEKQDTPKAWYGCYDGGWQGLISEQAFSHPAKFSRALISRIYTYALEQGYLKPGDTVLDCFGGVGLGALDAQANGLNWVGVELEKKFHDLGQGCDCTGISKADWVRFYGRWEKANYRDGRHWCPGCLAEVRQTTTNRGQLSFFEPTPSAAYARNSGIIPETRPHHYTGNLELFRKYAQPGTFAVLLNGDSRNLRGVIGRGVAEGVLSSPPYANSVNNHDKGGINWGKAGRPDRLKDSPKRNGVQGDMTMAYGQSAGQLGAMPSGNLDALLSSPPYINSVNQSAGANDTEARIERMRQAGIDVTNRANVGGGNGVARQPQVYGDSSGQLGAMPPGNLDALLSSPPYVQALGHDSGHPRLDEAEDKRRATEGSRRRNGYGNSNGQLSGLSEGNLDALLSSPPYANSLSNGEGPGARYDFKSHSPENAIKQTSMANYGQSTDNLGNLPEGNLDALLSSPPFAGNTGGRGEASRNGIDAALFDRHSGGMKRGTGDDPANLDHLPMKGFGDALVSSPPFENAIPQQDKNFKVPHDSTGYLKGDYGSTTGQLGTEQGQTFWAAARQIVTESYLALKPGSYTFWVCKKFVRNGKVVDFPCQWQQLCEATGFEYIETIRAMLVSPENEQKDLNGGGKRIQKAKKSFFRRLAEKNGSPAIDFEEVVILRKPEAA